MPSYTCRPTASRRPLENGAVDMMRPVLWSWACVALVISAGRNKPTLIAIPTEATKVLTCSGPDCTLVFQLNAPAVCLRSSIETNNTAQTTASTAQIALSACNAEGRSIFAVTANGTAAKGGFLTAATFTLESCITDICDIDYAGVYTFSRGSSFLRPTPKQLSTTTEKRECSSQGLLVYPNSTLDACLTGRRGPAGPTGPSGPGGATGQPSTPPPPVRPCPSRTRRRVRIIITNGTSAVAVAQPLRFYRDEYLLPLSDLEAGEDFYIQKYQSSTVGADGNIETVPAYTIQNVRSGQYIVADVLDNANLNVCESSPGIILENESEFPSGYATQPDYRFFASYDVNVGDGIILCPLYHRTNCLLPARKGYIRLASIQGAGQPTENYSFVNPSPITVRSFIDASAVRNRLIGRWYFRLIDSPKPLPPVWGK